MRTRFPIAFRLLFSVFAVGLLFAIACGGDSDYYDEAPITPQGQKAPATNPADDPAEGG